MELDVLISCVYIYILYIGGRDPYCTGGVRRRCYIKYLEEGTGTAPEEGEDGVSIIYQEEGTRIARAECEDGATIYIYLQLYK